MFFIHKWGDDFTIEREYKVKLDNMSKNFNKVTKFTGGLNLFLIFTLFCYKVLDVSANLISFKTLFTFLFTSLIVMAISLIVDGLRYIEKPQKSDNQKKIDVIIPNLNITTEDIYTNRM
jgi:hypothetical protein